MTAVLAALAGLGGGALAGVLFERHRDGGTADLERRITTITQLRVVDSDRTRAAGFIRVGIDRHLGGAS